MIDLSVVLTTLLPFLRQREIRVLTAIFQICATAAEAHVRQIATVLGLKLRNVQEALEDLEKAQVILREERGWVRPNSDTAAALKALQKRSKGSSKAINSIASSDRIDRAGAIETIASSDQNDRFKRSKRSPGSPRNPRKSAEILKFPSRACAPTRTGAPPPKEEGAARAVGSGGTHRPQNQTNPAPAKEPIRAQAPPPGTGPDGLEEILKREVRVSRPQIEPGRLTPTPELAEALREAATPRGGPPRPLRLALPPAAMARTSGVGEP